MSEAFDKLKEQLTKQGTLSNDDIEKMVAAHGAISDDEKMWLESEKHRVERDKQDTVTMDEYLAALKVLDSVEEGSPEFIKAEALVNKYESGT